MMFGETRWTELARAFGAALERVEAHYDRGQRAILIADARRALQQFTAVGNLAIEGLLKETKVDDPPSRIVRHPYRDD